MNKPLITETTYSLSLKIKPTNIHHARSQTRLGGLSEGDNGYIHKKRKREKKELIVCKPLLPHSGYITLLNFLEFPPILYIQDRIRI